MKTGIFFDRAVWCRRRRFGGSNCLHPHSRKIWLLIPYLRNENPTWCHLIFYFTYYALNMLRTLIYPSSGACDCVDELPHRSSCSQFVVCWSFCCGWYLVVLVLQAEAPNLQRTTNWEQDDRFGNSKTQSQAPDDGYINVRNMLSTKEVK